MEAMERRSTEVPAFHMERRSTEVPAFHIEPRDISCEGSTTVCVIFDEIVAKPCDVTIRFPSTNGEDAHSLNRSAQRINERTFHFLAPEHEEGDVEIAVDVNGSTYGTAILKYRISENLRLVEDVSQLYIRCMAEMCRYIENKLDRCNSKTTVEGVFSELDEALVRCVFEEDVTKSSIPIRAFEDLFGIYRFSSAKNLRVQYELPTLLHFSAKFGLDKFKNRLAGLPCAVQVSDMTNNQDLTPADLSKIASTTKLDSSNAVGVDRSTNAISMSPSRSDWSISQQIHAIGSQSSLSSRTSDPTFERDRDDDEDNYLIFPPPNPPPTVRSPKLRSCQDIRPPPRSPIDSQIHLPPPPRPHDFPHLYTNSQSAPPFGQRNSCSGWESYSEVEQRQRPESLQTGTRQSSRISLLGRNNRISLTNDDNIYVPMTRSSDSLPMSPASTDKPHQHRLPSYGEDNYIARNVVQAQTTPIMSVTETLKSRESTPPMVKPRHTSVTSRVTSRLTSSKKDIANELKKPVPLCRTSALHDDTAPSNRPTAL